MNFHDHAPPAPPADSKYGIFSWSVGELNRWNYEDAKEADSAWKKLGGRFPSPTAQWFMWRKELLKLEQSYYENKEHFSLLVAINHCARFRLPLPAWCVREFSARISKIEKYEVGTLDEAFGAPLPKGTRLKHKNNEASYRLPCVLEALEMHASSPQEPLAEIFKKLAAKYPLGTKLIEKWYYEHIHEFPVTETPTDAGVAKANTDDPVKNPER